MKWSPDSWRKFPIKQQPTYVDQAELESVESEIGGYPPLIFAGEARDLKEAMAKAEEIWGRAPKKVTPLFRNKRGQLPI